MSFLAKNFVLAAFGGRKKILAPPLWIFGGPPCDCHREEVWPIPPPVGVQTLPPLVQNSRTPPGPPRPREHVCVPPSSPLMQHECLPPPLEKKSESPPLQPHKLI